MESNFHASNLNVGQYWGEQCAEIQPMVRDLNHLTEKYSAQLRSL